MLKSLNNAKRGKQPGSLIPPPRAEDRNSLLQLIDSAYALFAAEPSHIRLGSSEAVVFVGDTHGDLACSQAIIEQFLPTHRVIFVGDYVDRAPEYGGSIANIAYLLRCKFAYPNRLILLRGNHEFRSVFEDGCFGESLSRIEGDDAALTRGFEKLFSQMPYVATTDTGIICMHGGLPDVWHREEMFDLPKGVTDYLNHQLVSQTVWNDNVAQAGDMRHALGFIDSPRVMRSGFSLLYGEAYLQAKLEIAGARVLIRGHDHRVKGHSLGNRVLTLMSNRACSPFGFSPGVLVARVDPRKRIATSRDIELIALPDL